ncbi:hypothetical protein GQR60_00470 [Labilibaculum sp. A4]|uniref:STAS/SEC14 domain-containing protein n=1 Tax=Labilibaculum euxinus TaxID=2686357 RepID=UPI000F625570|nr:STAS/SEC14 domain-containing protein [Labilibaculum euxinus]MDQ1769290.1 STAS/SEC14 domain-containing protein [Labilibaculum euxinus]MWN74814.1 hypothetical protein [Labilibaculum euxinus]
MISFSLRDSGIFYVDFSDTVTVEDIKNYLFEFERLDNLPKNIYLLYDLREVDMNLEIDDISFISKLAEKGTSSYKTIRTAFLVDTPKITAYSILFNLDTSSEKVLINVFSTEEAALKWLKQQVSYNNYLREF